MSELDAGIDARSMFGEAGPPRDVYGITTGPKPPVMVPTAVNYSIDQGPDHDDVGGAPDPYAAPASAQNMTTPLTEGPIPRPTSPNL